MEALVNFGMKENSMNERGGAMVAVNMDARWSQTTRKWYDGRIGSLARKNVVVLVYSGSKNGQENDSGP